MSIINRKIDIRDVDWPLCLLNCKKKVSQMKNGEQMEVIVNDMDVINNLISLFKQLPGHTIQKYRENHHYRLIITKKQTLGDT